MRKEAVTEKGITCVDLDAHEEAINVAMLLPGQTRPVEWQTSNEEAAVRRTARKVLVHLAIENLEERLRGLDAAIEQVSQDSRYAPVSFIRLLGGSHFVLALHKATTKGLRRNVAKSDVTQQGTEEGNPAPDEHRDTGDDQPPHLACPEEALNRNAAIQVHVLSSATR